MKNLYMSAGCESNRVVIFLFDDTQVLIRASIALLMTESSLILDFLIVGERRRVSGRFHQQYIIFRSDAEVVRKG